MRKFILTVCLFLLSGCVYGPTHLPPGTVDVYVIRDDTMLAYDRPWLVSIDGLALCRLGKGEYGLLQVSAGDIHALEAESDWWHAKKVAFVAEPDRTYYFLVGVRHEKIAVERIDKLHAEAYFNNGIKTCEVSPRREPVEVTAPVPEELPPSRVRRIPAVVETPVALEEEKPAPVETAPEIQAEPVVKRISQEIFFALNSAVIRSDMQSVLDKIVGQLNAKLSDFIVLKGHACDLGTDEYNNTLSQRRAEAVRDYLIAQGVQKDRIEIRYYGEKDPKYPNTTKEGRQRNRRVDFWYESIE